MLCGGSGVWERFERMQGLSGNLACLNKVFSKREKLLRMIFVAKNRRYWDI